LQLDPRAPQLAAHDPSTADRLTTRLASVLIALYPILTSIPEEIDHETSPNPIAIRSAGKEEELCTRIRREAAKVISIKATFCAEECF
jgi:hypothetical protein